MAGRNSNTKKSNSTIPQSGYGFLEALLNKLKECSTPLVEELEKSHENCGRRGYSAQAMLCVFILQFLLNQRYNSYLLAYLNENSRLLAMCGLDGAPSEATFSRYKKKLAGYQGLLDAIFNKAAQHCAGEIERLREAGVVPEDAPRLGEMLALDPTDIQAYAKPQGQHCEVVGEGNCTKKHRVHCDSPDRNACTKHGKKPCSDPDARWGYRTPKSKSGNVAGKDGDDRKEWFFGYKAHVAADTYYQIPLHMTLRPANENEGPKFAEDLDKALERHPWLKPKFVMADKGYDALNNFKHTVKRGCIPIFAVRRPPQDKKTGKRRYEGLYDEDGRPICVGGESMAYLGTDPDGGHHFRCRTGGCWLKNKVDWSRYCDSDHSEKPEGTLLRIMGIVPRFSDLWRTLYKKRTGIERGFSSGKRSRLLDSHQLLKKAKIGLHVNVSQLATLLTTLTHLMADDYKHMRHMRIKLPRTVRRRRQEPAMAELAEAQECDECCLCPEHSMLAA